MPATNPTGPTKKQADSLEEALAVVGALVTHWIDGHCAFYDITRCDADFLVGPIDSDGDVNIQFYDGDIGLCDYDVNLANLKNLDYWAEHTKKRDDETRRLREAYEARERDRKARDEQRLAEAEVNTEANERAMLAALLKKYGMPDA